MELHFGPSGSSESRRKRLMGGDRKAKISGAQTGLLLHVAKNFSPFWADDVKSKSISVL